MIKSIRLDYLSAASTANKEKTDFVKLITEYQT